MSLQAAEDVRFQFYEVLQGVAPTAALKVDDPYDISIVNQKVITVQVAVNHRAGKGVDRAELMMCFGDFISKPSNRFGKVVLLQGFPGTFNGWF